MLTLQPARSLPDGVYCLHNSELGINKPLPSFAAPFIIGGLSRLQLNEVNAFVEGTKVRFTLKISNQGSGEFNEGRVVLTVQKRDSPKSGITQRLEYQHPKVAPKSQSTFTRTLSTSTWLEGTYYFYGFVALDHVFTDPEAELLRFESEDFEIKR